jgi:hypothetical protein
MLLGTDFVKDYTPVSSPPNVPRLRPHH